MKGPEVRDMGELFPTRMTVVRLSDGAIWVNSPVPVSFADIGKIVSLGLVKYLVADTPRHVWRLEGWHTHFPEAPVGLPQHSDDPEKGGPSPDRYLRGRTSCRMER